MSERYYDHVISRTSPWVVNNGNIKVVFDNLIANGNCHSINTRISSFAWSNNQSSSVLPNEFGLFFSKLLPLVVPVQTVRSFRSLSWTWNRKINEIQVPKIERISTGKPISTTVRLQVSFGTRSKLAPSREPNKTLSIRWRVYLWMEIDPVSPLWFIDAL